MSPLLATVPSDYATPWWPVWTVWLLTVLVLLFAGRPTWTQRILGIAWLGLGLVFYSWAIFAVNGCIEGYADWNSCDVAGALMTVGISLMAGSAIIALSGSGRR